MFICRYSTKLAHFTLDKDKRQIFLEYGLSDIRARSLSRD